MSEVMEPTDLEILTASLKEALTGDLLLPGEAAYEEAVSLWNGAVTIRPAMVARCLGQEDVSRVVALAAQFDRPISVKGGGHDWAGRSLVPDGLVIDLSQLKDISIDAENQTARVGGGVLAGELVDAADPHGLVPVVGTARDVGIAGFSLGGGYGPLVNKFGLGVDNILAAQVVLPNGEIVHADADNHADLFWGLRGGGGNFGVVTELTLRLHSMPEMLTGIMLNPWEDTRSFLKGFAEITKEGHDELSVLVIMLTADNGEPAPVVFATWIGDFDKGREVLEKFNRLGNPSYSEIKPMSLAQFLAVFRVGERQHHFLRNRWSADFTSEISEIAIDAIEQRTGKQQYLVLHHFGGAPSRVSGAETAFGQRGEHYLIEVIACWAPEDDGNSEQHCRWARDFEARFADHCLPGGYANLLGPEEADLYAHAYGGNLTRLQQVKRKYDPQNRFRSTLLIP